MTIEEFAAMGEAEGHFELIRGELREVAAAGGRHGEIGTLFHFRITAFVLERRLGLVYTSDTGFVLDVGDRPVVVMPDVSFVRTDRLPPLEEREGFMPRPDLAVEVRSPSDEPADIAEKIALYQEAGVPLLWYCEPRRRTVTVYRPGREEVVVGEDGELDGDDVLPGFRLRVADVLAV
jgi:Uma2 family endonuclease